MYTVLSKFLDSPFTNEFPEVIGNFAADHNGEIVGRRTMSGQPPMRVIASEFHNKKDAEAFVKDLKERSHTLGENSKIRESKNVPIQDKRALGLE